MSKRSPPKFLSLVKTKSNPRQKYENFNKEEKDVLFEWFEKNPYPKTEDYEKMSSEINKPINKIQNWFKYHRRLSALESEDKIPQYKSKNVLSEQVYTYLKNYFRKKQNPNIKELRELSKTLDLKETQINSWFTYRRRKCRLTQNIKKPGSKMPRTHSTPKIKKFLLKKHKTLKNSIPLQKGVKPTNHSTQTKDEPTRPTFMIKEEPIKIQEPKTTNLVPYFLEQKTSVFPPNVQPNPNSFQWGLRNAFPPYFDLQASYQQHMEHNRMMMMLYGNLHQTPNIIGVRPSNFLQSPNLTGVRPIIDHGFWGSSFGK